jgi:hypothetical protein
VNRLLALAVVAAPLFESAAVAASLFESAAVAASPVQPSAPGVVSNAPRYAVWWSAGAEGGLVDAHAWDDVKLGKFSASVSPTEGYDVRLSCGGTTSTLQTSAMTHVRCGEQDVTVEATKLSGY